MNGCRIFAVVAVAVLLMLSFPMTAAATTISHTMKVDGGIILNNDIHIELIEVGSDIGWYARVRFYSYKDSTGRTARIYKDEYPESYTSGTGTTVDVTVDSIFSNGVSLSIESSTQLLVTDWYGFEEEESESESESAPVPKLEITRTIDPNEAEIGQIVRVTLTIKNTGNGTATNIVLDEGTITNTYKDGCPSAIDDIAGGATDRIEYYLTIGEDAEPETREIPSSLLNYEGEADDSYSTESQSSSLTIISREVLLPELTISIDPIDYVVTCGDGVPMAVTITNIGNASTEKVYVKVKGDLPPGVRKAKGEALEPVYDSIKPSESEEYEVTLVASEEGRHTVEMQVMWADREEIAVFEFRAEKSGLEKYYLYIIAAIPILLILLWITKRHREYSY
jgi:hypothetical protein